MADIDPKVIESVNTPGRVGVLATVDGNGQPNAAYFGSPQLKEDGTLVMGMMPNRSLTNLEQNPLAVFFAIEKAPVEFQTPGYRLYLKVKEIQKEGPILDAVKEAIAAKAGPDAAKMIQAGVVFDVTSVRAMVDMG
jgi:predicted pyridoxine 5'-phosphate oxidase superfamily flavin-nucleotide-binding protein